MGALGWDPVVVEDAENTRGRARGDAGLVEHEASEVEGMEAVGVLGRVDPPHRGLPVEAVRERQLQEDAVHGGVAVEGCDRAFHVGLGAVAREVVVVVDEAEAGGRASLVADVHLAGGVVTDQHGGETWGDPPFPEGGHAIGEGLQGGVCDHAAVEDGGGHRGEGRRPMRPCTEPGQSRRHTAAKWRADAVTTRTWKSSWWAKTLGKSRGRLVAYTTTPTR
jgi:hypothetical protein